MLDRSIFPSSWSKNQTSVNAIHDSGMSAFLLLKLVKKLKKFSIIFLYFLWLHTSFFFLLISSIAYKLFHIHLVHYILDFYSDTIPFDGAPSYKGHAVKYSYKITVGTSRVQGHSVLLRLPFRIMVLQGLYKSHSATTVHVYMLWFNFILGSNFLFFCFKLIIMLLSYITIPKNKRKENLNQG